ncbi:MAG: aminotransferase class I/II-fold pyridoxal phosphate-dependent enzyme [candidate division Zixibacteria bacterium]|nr:aminotransferase class I/II-fold pyridoxal phosphate-dependent enzyme [candidate division Zixibacteria bacterium]
MAVTRKIFIDRADRLQRMPVATALDLEHIAGRMARRGVEVIDLSRTTVPSDSGRLPGKLPDQAADWQPAGDSLLSELGVAVSSWYERRFGVELDPQHEVSVVPNSVMGLTLLALAFVDSGNMVLLPDPGLPFYRGAVALCGAGVTPYHLWERNDFLPSVAGLEEGLVGRTLMPPLPMRTTDRCVRADSWKLPPLAVWESRSFRLAQALAWESCLWR